MGTYVYVIHEVGSPSGPCKIGVAADTKVRRKVLQGGNPRELTVGFSIDVGPRFQAEWVEEVVHQKLADRRIHGEWFDVSERRAAECIQAVVELGQSQEGLPEPDYRKPARILKMPRQKTD